MGFFLKKLVPSILPFELQCVSHQNSSNKKEEALKPERTAQMDHLFQELD
jgi:hypothetical protein